MRIRTIGFGSDQVVGLDGVFNTVRVGLFYRKNLEVGEKVLLIDEGKRLAIGEAEVVSIEAAPLGEACVVHGDSNHTETGKTDGRSAERLFALIQKIYGPHIATPQRKATVIYLRKLE